MTFKERIIQSDTVQGLLRLLDQIILPGFDRQSLLFVLRHLVSGVQKSSLTNRAYAVAFNFLLGFFPALIFFFTLLPYLPVEGSQEQLLVYLGHLLPSGAYQLMEETINDLLNTKRGNLLSIGFISTLFFATRGINTLITTFDESAYIVGKRNFLKQRLVSFILLIILSLLLMTSVTLIIFGRAFLEYLGDTGYFVSNFNLIAAQGLNWFVITSLIYISISFIYWLGPTGISRWKFFSAGSSFTTGLLILTTLGFAFYVNNFSQYNKLFGSIGTIIVIMIWTYLVSLVLLLGFEQKNALCLSTNVLSFVVL